MIPTTLLEFFMENDLLIITLTMHFLFDSFLISKVLNKKFGEVYKVFLIVTLHVSILCPYLSIFPHRFFTPLKRRGDFSNSTQLHDTRVL